MVLHTLASMTLYLPHLYVEGKGLVKFITQFCSEFAMKNHSKHARIYVIHLVKYTQTFPLEMFWFVEIAIEKFVHLKLC